MNRIVWPTCTDPLAMLEVMFPPRGVDSVEPQSRKCRLYLLACARRAWEELPGVCRVVVRLAEQVYAGRLPNKQLRDEVYPHAEGLTHCRGEAEDVNEIGRELVRLGHATTAEVWTDADTPADRWTGYAHLAFFPFCRLTPDFRRIPPELHSADLLREVFGDPLVRHPPVDPERLKDKALPFARHIEATEDYQLLPMLADALEDAGYAHAAVLDHFRSGGPHARGCWALDLILGQK